MKRVALINDISGIGRCSLGAGIPILSCLGLQVSPVVTAVLTNQTAFSTYYKIDLPEIFDKSVEEWGKLAITADGFITGFFTSAQQVKSAIELYCSIKKAETLLIVDPIMGDDGARYSSFSGELCNEIAALAKKADIITPNLTEACMLAGIDYNTLLSKRDSADYLEEVAGALRVLNEGKKAVVITGVRHCFDGAEKVYNILLDANGSKATGNPAREGTYSGAGDIFAAVFGGLIIKGVSICSAFQTACDFVAKAIANTRDDFDRREGLDFEPLLYLLTNHN